MKIISITIPVVIFFLGSIAGYFFNLHTSRLHSLKEFAENTVEQRENDIKTFAAILNSAEVLDYETFIDAANKRNVYYRSELSEGIYYVYLRGLIIKFSSEGVFSEVLINSM